MSERGSITLWLLGICLCVLLLGGLSLDLWRLFEARRELAGLADGAAVAGATQLDEQAWRAQRRLALQPANARVRAVAYLRGRTPPGTRLTVRATADRVSVRLSRSLRLTLLALAGGPDALPVAAEATVRPVRRP